MQDDSKVEEVYHALILEIDHNLPVLFQSHVPQSLEKRYFESTQLHFSLISTDVRDRIWKAYEHIHELNDLVTNSRDETFFRRNDLWSILRNELSELREILANKLAALKIRPSFEKETDPTMEEEKFRERLLLLERLYWLDTLYEIGKGLQLSYFQTVTQYWQLDHQEAARQIAAAIRDRELLSICSQFPPKYVKLGGFQGKHYSADEKGVVSLRNSWDDVRGHVKKVLSAHSERAYGVLQAIINVGGTSAFFALIPEIEKVIGYEFYPSTLLPKLSSYRLVFKTGSNKYPEWSMPPEIITPVQEALPKKPPKYQKKERQHVMESVSDEILKQDRLIVELADQILEARRTLNLKFRDQYVFPLLKQDELATAHLRKLCSNEDDFNNRILTISSLIDGIETDPLKSDLSGVKVNEGSVALMQSFFRKHSVKIDTGAFANLQQIKRLRSTKYPIHSDKPEFLDSLGFFGFGYPPDWQELWMKVLMRYLDSLQTFSKSLELKT